MRLLRRLPALLLPLVLASCPKNEGPGPEPVNPKRCVVDLQATGLFKWDGSGAVARTVAGDGDLIGGQTATGTPGDVLMQNDKVRVIVEQPRRTVGPQLYGGGIIDADVVRPAGEQGHDQFGRIGLFYTLGRVTNVTDVEILADGASGGPAVVAASGDDVAHDLLNLKSLIESQGLAVEFVLDPEVPKKVRVTTYYVLSPGESRVRMYTAFCNDDDKPMNLPLVELLDFRGAVETFIPNGCANGLGAGDCLVDTSRWIGAQGDGVAYGLRSMSYADPKVPVEANATLGYGGVVGSFIEGQDMNGLLTWTDADARTRPGSFAIRQGESKAYLRDFVVAKDLAGISDAFAAIDGTATRTVRITAKNADGSPAPFARVSVNRVDFNWVTEHMETLVVTDAAGVGQVGVRSGSNYRFRAALEGHPIGSSVDPDGTAPEVEVTVAEAHTLTVNVADVGGGPVPAKVTVRCATTTCPFDEKTWQQHFILEKVPGGAAAIGFVPVTGTLTMTLPPFEYTVQVSRGPEYSLWPDTYPAGAPADLRTGDQTLNATLGRVVDSAGWMSGDFHVHAINSTDSLVPNEKRIASFLAEGVDVLISTDHEVITDYAPLIKELGAESFMASLIGEEVTTFSHGHFNSVNLTRDATLPNGGAFDHAGGTDGPTLRLTQLFPGLHERFPGSFVQINHGRGGGGAMTMLQVDTATLASHADPAAFRMAPAPDATPTDTKLFGDGFDGLEVANGSNFESDLGNDWMTFLSRGTVRTCTGVSDTHKAISSVGGYSRTWVHSGQSTPAEFTPTVFTEAVKAHKAFIGNGPFLTVTARKLDSGGQPVGDAVELGGTLSVSAGDSLELNVDVQAPDWVQFDRVELYTHAEGREAVNGESNSAWPDSRVAQIHTIDPQMLPVEAVPGPGNLRRVHVTHRFVAQVQADTWFAVMVRSVGSSRTLSPLIGARPWALSNAILVDADGSGAYDDFPLKANRSRLVTPPAVPKQAPRHKATPAELEKLLLDGFHLREH